MKRATIADVAAYAGVTKSTVSHALSGKRPVSAETRARIEQAIEALGYRPHPVAQRLATGQSRAIGFVYPLYGLEFSGLEMKFIAAAASIINQSDYAFVLLTPPDRRGDNLMRFIQSGLLDGVILMQVRLHDARVEALRRADLPFVLIGRCQDNTGLTFIDLDIDLALRLCVDHLAALGHRHLAYLHLDDPELGFSARATQAYVAACAAHGLAVEMAACDLTADSGADVAADLLTRRPEITALIVWNDLAAWGAIQMARHLGRRVPNDLSVICFDRTTIANVMSLQPTAIDIRPREMAAEAARLLLAQLEGKMREPVQILLEPKLLAGDTTAAPGSRT
ncbi:MAG: LacI family transcriptional regulator [Anaerolineae bacterium]|nr:LacI family transcriptional regulator [Anaerolineae bacterium]